MKKHSLLSIFMALIFLLSPAAFADGTYYTREEEQKISAAQSSCPTLSAQSYAVIDALTGETLFAKDEVLPLPVASTTKIMTALIVVENIADINLEITVDAQSCGIEGSSVNLYKGEKTTVKDLLYALMLESANDAAVCLARTVAGSTEDFAVLMNSRAEEIGMKNSHFTNPHGLEDPAHYSTAADMALLFREAMKNETLREIVSTKTYKMETGNGNEYRFLSNHNKLLKTFEPCIGGKTGFTKSAGRCLVTLCEKDGVQLITVTLNDPNDWEDHKNIVEYAFTLYSRVRLADVGKISIEVPVVGGKEKSITLSNRDVIDVSVRSSKSIQQTVEAPKFVYAPVSDTDKAVGKAVFYYNGKELASIELYPVQKVEKQNQKQNFFRKIWNIITGK